MVLDIDLSKIHADEEIKLINEMQRNADPDEIYSRSLSSYTSPSKRGSQKGSINEDNMMIGNINNSIPPSLQGSVYHQTDFNSGTDAGHNDENVEMILEVGDNMETNLN